MNWIVSAFAFCLVYTIVISQKIPPIQITNIIDPEVYVLNLHLDHCRRPKIFSWTNLRCECPLPLIEENGECSCDGCIYQDIKHGHSEGRSANIPRFINEIFEEIHEEMEDIKENVKNDTENGDIKKESIFNDNVKRENDDGPLEISNVTNNQLSYRENVSHSTPTTIIENTNEDVNLTIKEIGLRMLPVHPERTLYVMNSPTVRTSGVAKLLTQTKRFKKCKSERNKINIKQHPSILFTKRSMDDYIPLTDKPHNSVPLSPPKVVKSSTKLDLSKFKYFKLKLGHKPQSYSGSVVGGFRSGKIATGIDIAAGDISNFRGTGAISLGTGGGSAGGAAFTGIGKSHIEVNSKGTAASGFSVIGKRGKDGVSTSSLLLGTGDVIAINSLGTKGAASGVGITTQNSAGAATSAFGPASASVSAAVGKGGAHSGSSFNKTLDTSAGVERENEALVESSAVGNPNQNINQLTGNDPDFVNIPEQFQPYNYNFDSFFLGTGN